MENIGRVIFPILQAMKFSHLSSQLSLSSHRVKNKSHNKLSKSTVFKPNIVHGLVLTISKI